MNTKLSHPFAWLGLVCLVSAMGFSQISQAYIISTIGSPSVDTHRPTHIILVGHGDDETANHTNLFLPAAAVRAYKHHEVSPQDQVIVITGRETGTDDDFVNLAKWNLTRVVTSAEPLSGATAVQILKNYSRIASLDIYGHSLATRGIGLENDPRSGFNDFRLTFDTPGLKDLKNNFIKPGAYVSINGCNGGFFFAPTLSALWEIPVSGAFTETDYERLHDDGQWYFNNAGEYPATGSWLTTNNLSFQTPLGCTGRFGCLRMKPTTSAYHGYGSPDGGYAVGLGIYKFFCSGFDRENQKNKMYAVCLKGIANAILTYPSTKAVTLSSPDADLKEVARDYLCPAPSALANQMARNQACQQGLIATDMKEKSPDTSMTGIFSSMVPQLECSENVSALGRDSSIYQWTRGTLNTRDFLHPNPSYGPVYQGCNFKMENCQEEIDSNTHEIKRIWCEINAPANPHPQTVVKEYQLILDALHFAAQNQ